LGYRSRIWLIIKAFAEIAAEALAKAAAEVLAEVLIELTSGTELKARVEIRQLKELEAFDSLRLSILVAAEILAEVLAEAVAIVLLVAIRY
jgi:flagellar biosynthesis protein FliP